jgi:hypothetical protein
MSDYLWDKTGEPEADVEQLENLLGALKHQPRPLEIPASAMPTAAAATRTRPATLIFSRPRLAIAASLLLMLLAGTWFAVRQNESQRNQVATVNKGSETGGSKRTETAVGTSDETVNNASSDNNAQVKSPEDKVVLVKAATRDEGHRAPRRFVAGRQKLQTRVEENAPAPGELVATNGGMHWQVEGSLTPQQREATEQLMLALRMASAKFNYAQREMREIGRAGK